MQVSENELIFILILVFIFVNVFCAVCLKLESESVGKIPLKPWPPRVVGNSQMWFEAEHLS